MVASIVTRFERSFKTGSPAPRLKGWTEVAFICKQMGWSYETYLNQPMPLIETLRLINQAEDAVSREKPKKLKK